MIETPIFDELSYELYYEPGDPYFQQVYAWMGPYIIREIFA